ncbi:helix-turn-helix transcriptional regulator [Ancylobacter dichloromethanicus]
MKKVVPNGKVVKALREQLERLSTQKEMANEIGVSVRMLRMIENENAPITVTTADRLAKSAASSPRADHPRLGAFGDGADGKRAGRLLRADGG